jgi:hypothetical protein
LVSPFNAERLFLLWIQNLIESFTVGGWQVLAKINERYFIVEKYWQSCAARRPCKLVGSKLSEHSAER